MPTYQTPSPIDLAINMQVGRIDVIASDRSDTVVTVAPTNPERAVDRRGAEETKVEFDGQRLTITGPKPRISWIGAGPHDSADVTIELPTGSRVTAELPVGAVRTSGTLGATRIKALTGSIDVDATGDLWMRAGHGNATVGTAHGSVEITADHGQIKVGTVTGDASLKASHGSISVGEAGGELEAKLSYGDLEVAKATASVTAKTAFGSIVVGEVSQGSIRLDSGFGAITVGVRPGIPAWLDLASKQGRVRNELDSVPNPGDATPTTPEESVAVRARTEFGEITVQRSP